MKTLIALMLMVSAAHADCIQWDKNIDGSVVCMMDDLVNSSPILRILPEPGETTISAAPSHKCEDGWMHPRCAREVKEPIR